MSVLPLVTVAFEGAELRAMVLEALLDARESVWLTAFRLQDRELADALVACSARGVDVRLLVDHYCWEKLKHDATRPLGELETAGRKALASYRTLQSLHDQGRLGAVRAEYAGEQAYQHIKSILVDGRVVLLGSKNWSDLPSTGRANDMVRVEHPPVAACFAAAFRAMAHATGWYEAPPEPSRQAEDVWATVLGRGVDERVVASPKDVGSALLERIEGATTRVLGAFYILNSPPLLEALYRKARSGCQVRLVLDGVQRANVASGSSSARGIYWLERLGAVRALGGPCTAGGTHTMHHKFAVVDDTVITGSANWTTAAFSRNFEALLGVSGGGGPLQEVVATYVAQHQRLWRRGAFFPYPLPQQDPYGRSPVAVPPPPPKPKRGAKERLSPPAFLRRVLAGEPARACRKDDGRTVAETGGPTGAASTLLHVLAGAKDPSELSDVELVELAEHILDTPALGDFRFFAGSTSASRAIAGKYRRLLRKGDADGAAAYAAQKRRSLTNLLVKMYVPNLRRSVEFVLPSD